MIRILAFAAVATQLVRVATLEPSVADLQAAYDEARAAAAAKHVDGLVILGSQCDAGSDDRYFCQVGFKLRDGGDADRVYLDAISVRPRPQGGWSLLSGLCQ